MTLRLKAMMSFFFVIISIAIISIKNNKPQFDIIGNYYVYQTRDDDSNKITHYACWKFDENDSLYVTNLKGETNFAAPYAILNDETQVFQNQVQLHADSIIVGSGQRQRVLHRSYSEHIDPTNYFQYLSGKGFIMDYGWGCGFNISIKSTMRYEFYTDSTCSLILDTTTKTDSTIDFKTEELVSNYKYVVKNDSIQMPTPIKNQGFVHWHLNQIIGRQTNKLIINNQYAI